MLLITQSALVVELDKLTFYAFHIDWDEREQLYVLSILFETSNAYDSKYPIYSNKNKLVLDNELNTILNAITNKNNISISYFGNMKPFIRTI